MVSRAVSIAAVVIAVVILGGAFAVYAGVIGGSGRTPLPTIRATPTTDQTATPNETPSGHQSSAPSTHPTPSVSVPIPTPTPIPTPLDPNIHANAIVVPIRSSDLAMAVTGIVSTIYVKPNDQVLGGELLLTLDQTKYLSDIQVASSSVHQSQAAVDSATLALSQVPMGDAEQLAAAQADLALAQSNLDLAQSKLTAAQTALTQTELRAPIAGTVATLDVAPGEHVDAGETIVSIGDMTSWLVETTDLSQLDVVRILVGDRATMQFSALPGLNVGGTVESIEPRGTSDNGQVVFAVTIRPDTFLSQLRWNMSATVSITPSS